MRWIGLAEQINDNALSNCFQVPSRIPHSITMLSIHSRSIEIEGVPTEIMVQAFADRVLVLVTQLGKVGNLVHLIAAFTTDSITDI